MSKFNIQISALFSQLFTVRLDGLSVTFKFTWSEVNQGWVIDAETKEQKLFYGRVARLNTDILATVKPVLTGRLMLEGDIPTRDNLGQESLLNYYTAD